MTSLLLREWTTSTGVELSRGEIDVLRSTMRTSVQPTVGDSGLWDVTPGNVVGAVKVGLRTIIIEPKMDISRVLFLLGYVADPKVWREEDAEVEHATDVVSAVAQLLVNLGLRALRRGLLHGYRTCEDHLSVVRGRIDVATQLRVRPGLSLPVAVRYQEYDQDVLENQLLLAACQMFRAVPIRSATARRGLHRLSSILEGVTGSYFLATSVPPITWTRLNIHYRSAVELARVLLQQRSPDLHAGKMSSGAMVLDMSSVFEAFVRVSLREALCMTGQEMPTGEDCPALALDRAGRVRLQPDLTIWQAGRCSFVGDVKYKRDAGKGNPADLYQMLAYAVSTRLPSAMLVYADGPPSPTLINIENANVLLMLERLDLAQPTRALLQRVDQLASTIRSMPGMAAAH